MNNRLIKTLSDQTEKKTSLHSVPKNYGFASTTSYYSFDKDFLAPDFQNTGRFKRVFIPDLAKELRERAIKLQAMFNRMCGAEFRKLAFQFAEANNLQNPFSKNKKKKLATPDSSKR